MFTQTHTIMYTLTHRLAQVKSNSVAAACQSGLSSCSEIKGEHRRNLLLGYKTEAAQGKNGNASDIGGRGLPWCNHSC